jgi:hypothetical protein
LCCGALLSEVRHMAFGPSIPRSLAESERLGDRAIASSRWHESCGKYPEQCPKNALSQPHP